MAGAPAFTGEEWDARHNGARPDEPRLAVDLGGFVLDILVPSRRDTGAARKCFRGLPEALQYVPRVRITAERGSSAAQGLEQPR